MIFIDELTAELTVYTAEGVAGGDREGSEAALRGELLGLPGVFPMDRGCPGWDTLLGLVIVSES